MLEYRAAAIRHREEIARSLTRDEVEILKDTHIRGTVSYPSEVFMHEWSLSNGLVQRELLRRLERDDDRLPDRFRITEQGQLVLGARFSIEEDQRERLKGLHRSKKD